MKLRQQKQPIKEVYLDEESNGSQDAKQEVASFWPSQIKKQEEEPELASLWPSKKAAKN